MRDKKRTFEVEVVRTEIPLVRPAKPGSKKGEGSMVSGEQKQDSQFSRDLILRLIEWIKQI
jgi:hypothetical protein